MSHPDQTKIFDRAIDLVINADKNIQEWSSKLMTIQTGMGLSVAALITWGTNKNFKVIITIVVLISTISIILTWLITDVILRQLAWQSGYVKSAQLAQGVDCCLYREKMVEKGKSHQTVLNCAKWVLIAGWAILPIALIVFRGQFFCPTA